MTPAGFRARAALLREQGVLAPDWFIDGYIGRASVENFMSILRQWPPGVSEVPVHVAMVDEQLRRLEGCYVEQRAAELAVVLDPQLREALETDSGKLVDFSDLTSSQTD